MILPLARPPRATFGCLHAPPGALRGWVPKKSADPAPTVQEIIDHRCEACRRRRTAACAGIRRPPARPRTLRCIRSVHALTLSSVRSSPFPRSLMRPVVRSCAHPPIPTFAHPPIAHSLARSLFHMWLDSFVHRPHGSLAWFPFFYRSLARFGISAFARSLARSLVRSLIRSSFVRSCMARFVHSSLARFSCLCFLHFFARSLLQGNARQTARPAEGDGPRPAPVFASPRALASSGRSVPSFITRAFIYHSFISIAVWKARPPRLGCLAGRRVLSCRRLPGPPARPERPARRRAEGRW